MRSPVQLTPARPAPLPPGTLRLPCHEGAAVPCSPTLPAPPLRAPPAGRGRCLSPISATDLQREHPRNRWIPSLETPRGASARVEGRLTPPPSFSRAPDALLISWDRSRRPGGGERRTDRRCPAAACSAARNARNSTSDAPCRPWSALREAGQPKARTAPAARPSRSTASAPPSGPLAQPLPRCRRDPLARLPPTIRSAFHRRVLPRGPLAQTAGSSKRRADKPHVARNSRGTRHRAPSVSASEPASSALAARAPGAFASGAGQLGAAHRSLQSPRSLSTTADGHSTPLLRRRSPLQRR